MHGVRFIKSTGVCWRRGGNRLPNCLVAKYAVEFPQVLAII